MIFGWLENGRTDRWVMIDACFPHPALHNGRAAMRAWADRQNRLRALEHTAGPRRCSWPCKTSVKESGHVLMNVWPCGVFGVPRAWTDGDRVWRPVISTLAELMAADIQCAVDTIWMGGTEIERQTTSPSLRDRSGFIGWGKGQREPKIREVRAAGEGLRVKIGGANLRIMPQGEHAWH